MSIRTDLVERRKHNRYKVKEGIVAEFQKPRLFKLGKPRIVKSAPIIDICLDGLAFQYTDRTMWSPNFNELSISKAAVDVKIDNVPFKAISDFLTSRLSDSTLIRRCGVKFGGLTPNQKEQLHYFIQDHTLDSHSKDRRAGKDRRQPYASRHDGLERRKGVERRKGGYRRHFLKSIIPNKP